MALFDDASLVVTPNGYKAGTLYSIKPTSGAGDMTVVRATTATRVNSAGLIESVANNVPRLDYSNGTCPSLLLEPQRTNLLTYSEQLDNAIWTKSGVTITANAFNSPSGTLTSDLVTPTISDASLRQSFLPTGVLQYNFSIWLRSSTGSNFSTTLRVWRDSPFQNISNVVINVTTEWQRFNFSFTTLDATTHVIAIGGSSTLSTGENFYAWGAQLELGSYPTSYIPTTSAAVTRNADLISKTGISSLIGQTEGVIFADFVWEGSTTGAADYPLLVYGSSYGNFVALSTFNNTNAMYVYVGGANVVAINGTTFVNGQRYKIAMAYKLNDFVYYLNGTQMGTDTSAGVPSSMANLRTDTPYGGKSTSQKYNSVIFFPTRLTNAELASLTTI
jgi:hypothetical protein